MRNYRNEAAFGKHLCECLVQKGYFVQRIETGGTGRGVPDVYIGAPKEQYWVEFKRIHAIFSPKTWEIPWRPGQQAWMYKHYKLTGVPCFTFVAYNNLIACIPMTKIYSGDRVTAIDILKIWVRAEDVTL
jgi:hypothetical protein